MTGFGRVRIRPDVNLPKADDLKAVLAAIRDADLQGAGVTHVRVGGLEVRIAAPPQKSPGAEIVEALNKGLPTDSPAARRAALGIPPGERMPSDILEDLAAGRPLVTEPGDPLRPQG